MNEFKKTGGYANVWDALAECFKLKLWGSVRVVLKDDGLYYIEPKE